VETAHFLEFGEWSLERYVGIENSFFVLHMATIRYTWAVLLGLFLFLLVFRLSLNKIPIVRHIVLSFIDFFIDLVAQTIGSFHKTHFFFVTALFIFILLCNVISLVPGLDEPTKDVNTTFALGIIAFLYVQIVAIKTQGIAKYVREFFKPIFFMVPLNVLGKLSSVLSLSIRLFGNIFGGSIISTLYFSGLQIAWWAQLLGFLSGLNFVMIGFFTVFEGFLQAFVFMMLTLTYISLSMQQEGH
jgi:F-type H+-transporting ATPase subunit a